MFVNMIFVHRDIFLNVSIKNTSYDNGTGLPMGVVAKIDRIQYE
jgi:hypothetical protein